MHVRLDQQGGGLVKIDWLIVAFIAAYALAALLIYLGVSGQ